MRKIVHTLPFIVLLLWLTACGVPGDKARISGEFDHLTTALLYLYSQEGEIAGIDTVNIEKGAFSIDLPLDRPALLTLMFPNFSKRYLIAVPGEEVRVSGDANHLQQVAITGTEENDALTNFREQNLKRPEGDQRLAAAQFIRDNAGSLASVALFREYFVEAGQTDVNTTKALLGTLQKAQPETRALKATAAFFSPVIGTSVGALLPDFTAQTADGRTVRRADFLGKNLLIVFTAGWNPNSYLMNRRVRDIERTMGSAVRTLVVSLDLSREMLTQQRRTDSISAPVLYDGKGMESPLLTTFGIRFIPGNLLVNAQGRIVARDIPEDRLKEEVTRIR